MKQTKKSVLEKRVEKRFREAKKRAKIRERYGVFTQGMLEDLFEEKLTPIIKKLQKVDEKLDWLIGEYKKFEEEHTLLVNRVWNHEDRLEKVEEKLGIASGN